MDIEVRLISIGLAKNDITGVYVRHTEKYIIIKPKESDNQEFKFHHNGKQVGNYIFNGSKGSWFVFTEDLAKLKKLISSDKS
ncbi:hypothetical protein CCP1ISM_1170003 [Azospirillaceae bacterium]